MVRKIPLNSNPTVMGTYKSSHYIPWKISTFLDCSNNPSMFQTGKTLIPGFSPWLTATPLTWQICYRIPSKLSPLRFWKNGEIAWNSHGNSPEIMGRSWGKSW
jgi:hypothetical protein